MTKLGTSDDDDNDRHILGYITEKHRFMYCNLFLTRKQFPMPIDSDVVLGGSYLESATGSSSQAFIILSLAIFT